MEYFVSLERAQELSIDQRLDLEIEMVSLDDAHGRFLATDLASKVNDPPFDNSSMDGFAVRHEDTIGGGSRLEIIGTVQAAAEDGTINVGSGQAARIMTGAPMPPGSDSIIMVEKTETKDGWVTLLEESRPGFVRLKGENLEKGQIALTKGTRMTPHHTGLAATMGHADIPVFRKPIVAIISTGDELKQPGEPLDKGEIYESNSFGLAGLVKLIGGVPMRMDACADSIESLRTALNEAATSSDVILTSGGVSMGEWDLVRRIMEEEGDIIFWRMRIRPGSPPILGTWKGTPLFGLPGNPVSSHVVFRMLTRPWILEQYGCEEPETMVPVRLLEDVKAATDCHTLRRVSVMNDDGDLVASMKTHQGSGNLHSLVCANALTYLPPGSTARKGETIQVILM